MIGVDPSVFRRYLRDEIEEVTSLQFEKSCVGVTTLGKVALILPLVAGMRAQVLDLTALGGGVCLLIASDYI